MTDEEIDVLVAKNVMGLPHWEPYVMPEIPGEPCGTLLDRCPNSHEDHARWHRHFELREQREDKRPMPYSADIASAWLVVERMQAEGLWLSLKGPYVPENKWWAGFMAHPLGGWEGAIAVAMESTAPQAICLAALRAKGMAIE